MKTITVKSAFTKAPDGGCRIAIFDRDARHPGGELTIADEAEHEVFPTPEVRMAVADGRLIVVDGALAPEAPEAPEAPKESGKKTR